MYNGILVSFTLSLLCSVLVNLPSYILILTWNSCLKQNFSFHFMCYVSQGLFTHHFYLYNVFILSVLLIFVLHDYDVYLDMPIYGHGSSALCINTTFLP